ncbi:unnamed protein product [Spodoptera littoralis]|uniref:Uncharacterized protein n=1 Tax=Spodoptera littoralis TaxID=7109 RepID=A0A9P0HZX7_SPOLI|nr:unnamed protein product [Spodoptera littoralis]CAH1637628.1 unnamed protein product [Spodoptera littoralis]
MTMKLEISDSQSNQSDISSDSQSSQDSSTNDFVSSVPTSRSLLTLHMPLFMKIHLREVTNLLECSMGGTDHLP